MIISLTFQHRRGIVSIKTGGIVKLKKKMINHGKTLILFTVVDIFGNPNGKCRSKREPIRLTHPSGDCFPNANRRFVTGAVHMKNI